MEPSGSGSQLKRPRAPLSDSEDNVFSSSERNDGQKRQRLDRAGQENLSPTTSSGRSTEQALRPDTPAINSVRSRVQQLTQRREGGPVLAQRCLSDPGADNLSIILHNKGFTEHLLGEDEFHQRMERFKAPIFQPSPSLVPSSPRTCSDLVSGIQQKLQGSLTPSSKQAVFIRQEREKELRLLNAQPICENAWLKRSSSDPTISENGRVTPGPSPSTWTPHGYRRIVHWPPVHPWDGDNSADGSFTETLAPKSEKPEEKTTGEKEPCDTLTAATRVEIENCSEYEEKNMCREPDSPKVERDDKEKEEDGSVREEKVIGSPVQPCELFIDEDQSVLESPPAKEMSGQTRESPVPIEEGASEALLLEGEEERRGSSHGEEDMEPSTDEEQRLWHYPQVGDDGEWDATVEALGEPEGESWPAGEEQEKSGGQGSQPDVQDRDDGHALALVSRGSESLEPEEAIIMDERIESEVSPLVESLTTEKAIRHSNREACNTDPMPTVDTLAQTDTGKLEETYVEFKGPAEPSILEQTEPCGRAREHRAMTDNDPAHNPGAMDDMAPMNRCDPTHSHPDKAAQPASEDPVEEMEGLEPAPADGGPCAPDGPNDDTQTEAEEAPPTGGRGIQKKVSFVMEPELINDSLLSEANTSCESQDESSFSGELSSHDETNTAEMIDQMFEEVLEYAGRMEEERRDNEDTEDRDSGIGNYSGDKSKMDTESEKERSEEEEGEQPEKKSLERGGENEALETSEDELLTFPPSGILSPLSKSVEAVVTPLQRLAVSTPPSLLLTPEEEPFTAPAAESAPLYSIDAYRTQRQSKLPAIQSVTPVVQRRAPEKSRPPPSINTKEKIVALTEEAGKLQTVISQTLQALGCCTDETHGRGSLEEAEAEKLLLVSCEKRAALLAEVTRLRDERGSASEEPAGADGDYLSQQPCRGTVNIGNVQLPLKVEFVCSSRNRKGRPSHYFFILIRYGPCNIVATPLATAADAKNGDTISFPTSVTLKDICSNFEIDVEVYSLSHASGSTCTVDRISTKPRVTPRKLLSTITHRANNSLTASTLPALNTRRSSSFCLVGSHKITLSSLGQTKFPLDKMKFDGKIRKLLGDEFQEKVPFLSPLEGNIYLRLDSEGHSSVQHQGFLTMFEVVNGFGAWHRRFFTLEGSHMFYWNHPNDKEAKAAEGTISLASLPSLCVKPVKRDSCARPFTFELVSNLQTQLRNEAKETVAKRWFSSDTKQERCDWMDKLNQVLLDLHTWTPTQAHSQPQEASSSLRESLL
ncbi:anillin, actin binding protein 2 isoform X1 [Gadus morhua]|uniref:anillin, actin binding protein 2 isoform X1 n=1 Tax=Gadus morhua TaxID=8049 RepID=UPI0011B72C35|nr:anillin-like isoform X1 [Gadus morhua]